MAIIYQKDKNAIKFIKDFYKQITKKTPSQPQVDSILANFDGNYHSMIREMYANLLGKVPSENQIGQIVSKYTLKKKDLANGLSGLGTGGSVLSGTKEPFKTDLNLKTDKEIQKGLEGAKEGTSATLNFNDTKPRSLEGRQSYPIDVYADGEYQGVLNPGESMTTSPASKIVEIPKGKTFNAQEGAVVPFINDEQQSFGPVQSSDNDVWDYDDISKNFLKNGEIVPLDQVPDNIKSQLDLKIKEEIDIKNLNKSRRSADVEKRLKELEGDKDFKKFLKNTTDTASVFKALQLYHENPNLNIDHLLQMVDPKNQTSSKLEVQYDDPEIMFGQATSTLEIPNAIQISDQGRDIMRMSDDNTGDQVFTVPTGKIDPDNPDGTISLDEEGLNYYESLLNLNELSNKAENEHFNLFTNVLDFNNLNEEDKERFMAVSEELKMYSRHSKDLKDKINKNNLATTLKTINLKDKDTVNKYAIGNLEEIQKIVDPENKMKGLNFDLVVQTANEFLRSGHTPEHFADVFIDEYQRNNGVFDSYEDAKNDQVFLDGLSNVGKEYNNMAVTNAANILNLYDEKTLHDLMLTQTTMDIGDPEDNDLYKIEVVNQNIRNKSEDIRKLKVEISKEKNEAEKLAMEKRLANMINVELPALVSKHEEIKKRHYDVSNQLADPVSGVSEDAVQFNLTVRQKEENAINKYKTGYTEGEKLDLYTKARNKIYSNKLGMEEAYNSQKFELPNGQEMTLAEMKKMLWSYGLSKKGLTFGPESVAFPPASIVKNIVNPQVSTAQRVEDQLEEDGVGIGLMFGFSQLDKKILSGIIKRAAGPYEDGIFSGRTYKKEDWEAMLNHLTTFRNRYQNNLTEFLAIQNALSYNIDFAKIYEGRKAKEFFTQMGQSFSTGMTKSRTFTDSDIVNNMLNISKKNNIPVTALQEEEGEIDFSDMLAQGLGTTFSIMAELMVTMPLGYGAVATSVKGANTLLNKVPRFAKMLDRSKSTKIGNYLFETSKDMVAGSVAFEATRGDVIGWEMGAAEGFVQSNFKQALKTNRYTRMLMGMYEGLGKKVPLKALYYPQRIGVGGTAETIAEYAGEFVNDVSKNGYDWERNYERVFGKTRDERLKRLGVTMVMTFGLSSAFTIATSNTIEGELKRMVDGSSDLTNPKKGGKPLSPSDKQHAINLIKAKEEYRNSAFGEAVTDLEERTYDQAKEMTPDILKPLNQPLGRYIIDGKSLPKKTVQSLMSDPTFIEDVKNGKVNVRVENDIEFEREIDQSFDNSAYIKPDKHGTTYGVEALEANKAAAKGRIGRSVENLINESLNKGQENVSEYGKNELYLRMSNIEEYYQIYHAALKAGDWNTVQRFADSKFNYTPEQLNELKDRFDSDVQETKELEFKAIKLIKAKIREKEADKPTGKIETEGEIKSRAESFADQLDAEFTAKGIQGIKNQFYNNKLDVETTKELAKKLQSRYGDIETNIILNALSNAIDGKKTDVSLTTNQERVVNKFLNGVSLNDISGLLESFDKLPNALSVLETFNPVQNWGRKLEGQERQNIPFSYSYKEKRYKGRIQGIDFFIKKKPGGGWYEINTRSKIGDTKAEAIDYLMKIANSSEHSISSLERSLGRKIQPKELRDILKIARQARSNSNASTQSESVPESNKEAVDKILSWIDDRLDWLAKNKDGNIRSDILGGLGTKDTWIEVAQVVLRSIKAGLVAGKSLAAAINNAFEKLDLPKNIKEEAKNNILFGVTRIDQKAVKTYNDVKGNKKKFIKALQLKYPNQFTEQEASSLHQMVKKANIKDPKIRKSLYKGSKLERVENAIRLEEESKLWNEQNPEMQLQPYEISYSKWGYPKFGKGGEIIMKEFDYEIIDAPIFNQVITPGKDADIQREEMVDFSGRAMLTEFNRLTRFLDQNGVNLKDFAEDATGWYKRVNDVTQEKFGPHAKLYFELLAASSPQTTPANNHKKANEATTLYAQGKLDKALEIYRGLINPIIKKHTDGLMTELQATNAIKSLSNHENIKKEIRKARGVNGTWGAGSNGAMIRVLHGNWLDRSPALKTQQFYQNLSQRDHNATIDVWAARFMRRLLYDSVYKTDDVAPAVAKNFVPYDENVMLGPGEIGHKIDEDGVKIYNNVTGDGNTLVGELSFDDSGDVLGVYIDDGLKGQGIGTMLYRIANDYLYKNQGLTLNSDSAMSDEAKAVWEGFVQKGLAKANTEIDSSTPMYTMFPPSGPSLPSEPIFWRRRQAQEQGVSDPDFIFSQEVFKNFTEKYGNELGLGDLKIEDAQALFWHLEKFYWDKMGYSRTVTAKELATLDTEILALESTERVVVGSSAYIGKGNELGIKSTAYRQIKKAMDRGATDEELSHVMVQSLTGAVRMDQAKTNLNESIKLLNPMAADVRIGEGVYNNQAEPNITASAVIIKGTDVSNVVDQAIEIGVNNNQTSVFISKTVDPNHPNARPFARIEFNNPLIKDQQSQIMDVMDQNGISGYSFNYDQKGDIIGVEFQAVPEYDMKKTSGPISGGSASLAIEPGLVVDENFDSSEFMSKLNVDFDSRLEAIKETLGKGYINYVEKGYVNTKVITNGEYESITREEKSFKTDIKTELIRRQAALDSGIAGEDITDIRGGYDENGRSLQGYEKLIRFADKLDKLYNEMGTQDGVLYSDFGFITAVRVALKLASSTLRATSNIKKSIDRAIKYLKENNEWNRERETFIKQYFNEDMYEDKTLISKNEKTSTGENIIKKEDVGNLEEESLASSLLSEEQEKLTSQNANPKEGYTKEDLEAAHRNIVGNHRIQVSGGKDAWFSRLKDFLRDPFKPVGGEIKEGMPYKTRYEQFKTWSVDSKYHLKNNIERIAKNHNLGEAAFSKMLSFVTWGNAPGAAKHYLFNNVNPIFSDMQPNQIEKVGLIGLFRRVVELDNIFDVRKQTIDELLKDTNNLQNQINNAKEGEKTKGLKSQVNSLKTQMYNLYNFGRLDKNGNWQYREGSTMALVKNGDSGLYEIVLANNGTPVEKGIKKSNYKKPKYSKSPGKPFWNKINNLEVTLDDFSGSENVLNVKAVLGQLGRAVKQYNSKEGSGMASTHKFTYDQRQDAYDKIIGSLGDMFDVNLKGLVKADWISDLVVLETLMELILSDKTVEGADASNMRVDDLLKLYDSMVTKKDTGWNVFRYIKGKRAAPRSIIKGLKKPYNLIMKNINNVNQENLVNSIGNLAKKGGLGIDLRIQFTKLEEVEDGSFSETSMIQIPPGLEMFARKDWQSQEYWKDGDEVNIKPWRLLHPSVDAVGTKERTGFVLNKESAEGMLKNYNDPTSTDYEPDFKYLNDKTDQVFNIHKELLSDKYEQGLINEETYRELKDIDYIPRKFIDYFHLLENDPMVLRDDSRTRINNIGKPLEKLKLGSDKVLFIDPVKLAQSAVAAHYRLKFFNQTAKKLYETISLIEEAESKPKSKTDSRWQKMKSEFFGSVEGKPIPIKDVVGYIVSKENPLVAPYVGVTVLIGGNKELMALTPEAHSSMFSRPDDLTSEKDYTSLPVRISSRAAALTKTFATGAGRPDFFISNIAYDLTQQILFTDTYNNNIYNRMFLPFKFANAVFDWGSVLSDATKYVLKSRFPSLFRGNPKMESPQTDDFFLRGGNLDFLHLQGVNNIRNTFTAEKSTYDQAIESLIEEEGISYNEAKIRVSRAEAAGELFISPEDKPMSDPNYRGTITTIMDALSSLNSLTELTGRLANKSRWEKTLTTKFKKEHGRDPNEHEMGEIKNQATAQSVDYANFNGGGRGVKNLDKRAGFAYLNAAAVTLDKSVRNAKRNPVQTMWDLGWTGLVFGGLAMTWNLTFKTIDDEDKQEEIDIALDLNHMSQIKNKYHNITSNDKLEKMLNNARSSGALQEAALIEALLNLRKEEDELREKAQDNISYVYDKISPYDKANHMPILIPFNGTSYIDPELEKKYAQDILRLTEQYSQLIYSKETERAKEISLEIRRLEKLRRKNQIVKANYLKFPTEPKVDAVKLPFEDLAYRRITGRPSINRRTDYLNQVRSVLPSELTPTGILSSNPIMGAASKLANYDMWRGEKLWKGRSDLKGYLRVDHPSEPERDRFLVDLSEGISKMFSGEDGQWTGPNVVNWKGAGSSIFTNLDRNPWYRTFNSLYTVSSDPFKSDADKIMKDNYQINFLKDFFGATQDRYMGEVDFTRRQVDPLVENSKLLKKEGDLIDAVMTNRLWAYVQEEGIKWDSQNKMYVNEQGNPIDHPINEEGEISPEFKDAYGNLKTLGEIIKTVNNKVLIKAINQSVADLSGREGFLETYQPDLHDWRRWTTQMENNLRYKGVSDGIHEIIRASKYKQYEQAAWLFVALEETEEKDDYKRLNRGADIRDALIRNNVDIWSPEYSDHIDSAREWFNTYRDVLKKEEQGLIGPEESKALLDSMRDQYRYSSVQYEDLIKGIEIPQE